MTPTVHTRLTVRTHPTRGFGQTPVTYVHRDGVPWNGFTALQIPAPPFINVLNEYPRAVILKQSSDARSRLRRGAVRAPPCERRRGGAHGRSKGTACTAARMLLHFWRGTKPPDRGHSQWKEMLNFSWRLVQVKVSFSSVQVHGPPEIRHRTHVKSEHTPTGRENGFSKLCTIPGRQAGSAPRLRAASRPHVGETCSRGSCRALQARDERPCSQQAWRPHFSDVFPGLRELPERRGSRTHAYRGPRVSLRPPCTCPGPSPRDSF